MDRISVPRLLQRKETIMKIEEGVMVMKNGKGWGVTFNDGECTMHGWMEPEDAPMHDPKYCTKTTDVTWEKSPWIEELLTAKLVRVRRRTEVDILDDLEKELTKIEEEQNDFLESVERPPNGISRWVKTTNEQGQITWKRK